MRVWFRAKIKAKVINHCNREQLGIISSSFVDGNLLRAQINWWLYDMERRHSNVMSVFELGRSWEDRSMIAVKVSTAVRINSLADHPVRLLHFLPLSFSSHYVTERVRGICIRCPGGSFTTRFSAMPDATLRSHWVASLCEQRFISQLWGV